MGLFDAVKQKVSADKNRYQEGEFNLDLTYITDRIVGTFSFPKSQTTIKRETHK